MNENRRCSTLFHLLVPGGKWHTERDRPVSSANVCSSHFQRRSRTPLLPPPSAVMRIWRVRGYKRRPFPPPPAANRGDRKRTGVMVRPHIDEPGVAPHVIDAVRISAGNVGVRKVVALHGDRLFRGPPLLAAIEI